MIRRLLTATREAWWTFRLSLLGWEVESYALRVWPGFGRCTGNLNRWQPTYPTTLPKEHEHGWGLSSEGESYPERWDTPLAAVLSGGGRLATIKHRLNKSRNRR